MKAKLKIGDTVKCVSRKYGERFMRQDNIRVGDELQVKTISSFFRIQQIGFGKIFVHDHRNFKLVKRGTQ
jgi:hypothetical protein